MRSQVQPSIASVFSIALSLLTGCGGGGSGQQRLADLTITSTHTGSFAQGQVGATYIISVSNSGSSPTRGTVTVTDNLPIGMSATALTGGGWNCTLAQLTCTRSDQLDANARYPAVMLTVNVALTASPATLTNSATVSGGGEQNKNNDSASDATSLTCAPGLPSFCGQFLLMSEGYDNQGPYRMVGSLTGDGFGNLTSGVFDETRVGSSNGPVIIQSGSNYGVGTDGRGSLNLVTPIGNKLFKLAFSSDHGDLIESESSNGTHAVAFVGQQGGNFEASEVNGVYAFQLIGERSDGSRVGMIAELAGDGSCGLSSNGNTVTINDGGAVSGNVSFAGTCDSGGVSTIDPATGRGTSSLTFTGGPLSGATLHFVFYMFGGKHALAFIEKDQPTSGVPLVSGLARRQSSPGIACGATSSDLACLLGAWGKTPAGTSHVFLARGVAQTSGTMTMTFDENKGGVITSNHTTDGFTLSTTANAYGTISPPSGSLFAPIDFVLFGQNGAFILSEDDSVSAGYLFGQSAVDWGTAPPPLLAGFNSLANGPPATSHVVDVSGIVTPSGPTSGSFSGTWDSGTASGFASSSASGSYGFDATTGRGTGTLNVPGDPTGPSASIVFYVFAIPTNVNLILMENDVGNTASRFWILLS